ncbi:MAG: hypothetical protein Q9159_000749 [Coniocarpon cinnabarinum]
MLAITITADLQNVTALTPIDTETQPFHYTLTLQCTSCRETHPNPVTVTRFSEATAPGSKPGAQPFNLVFKCRNCTRTHTLSIPAPPAPYRHPEDEAVPRNKATKMAEKKQNLLSMDCRGIEVVGFVPEGLWSAKGLESGIAFEEVVFEGGKDGRWEWFDYDEKVGEEVSVTNAVFEIGRA